jgi:molybdopterin-guanine dinucleotide biosynthesis protein A
MGREKGALPYGSGTLAEHQTARLAGVFDEVWFVAKRAPSYAFGDARLLLDTTSETAAAHGLHRVLAEGAERAFVLAVDLPVLSSDLAAEIGRRALESDDAALVPEAGGRLQPLAAVWTRRTLPELERRIARGELSLHELARAVDARILREVEWRKIDPSGNSFLNMNTLEEYAVLRERA